LVAGGITTPPMPQGTRSASAGAAPATPSSFYPPAAPTYAGQPPLSGARVSGPAISAQDMTTIPLQPVRGQSWSAGGVGNSVTNPSAAAGYQSGAAALPLAPSVMLPQVALMHFD
jgi:hypothetical protein